MKRRKKMGRSLVVIVKGKAEAAFVDVAVHQGAAGQLSVLSIGRGLVQARRGEGRTVEEVFDELEFQL